ncbi:MAG TPA: hypothetical protein ENJ09_16275, partial [Planctomycetes bacterium]|nr:hypothetical protein [Planctomycetota bacterium]
SDVRTALLLPVLCLAIGCSETRSSDPRSIVFVSVDTLAAGHTSLHGYERETTPNLDSLARESVVFERCLANAPWTTPSYMSQFTGLLPWSLEPTPPASGEETGETLPWSMGADQPTLAECLSDAGFRTAAFIDNPNVGSRLGFDRGFDVFDESAAEIGPEDPAGGIQHIVPRALRWLDGLDAKDPFFLFVQVLDVHGPYLPPPRWRGHFEGSPPDGVTRPDALAVALEPGLVFGAIPRYIADPIRSEQAGSLPVLPIVNAYDDGIRALDEDLGLFLAALRERGILDRALLVISADHGESLGERDSWFDHQLLRPEVLHVPLLFRPPGGNERGTRIPTGVELIDLFPTLLGHAGVALPSPRPGRSLLGEFGGGKPPRPRPLFARGDVFDSRAIESGRWKLLVEHPTPENSGVVGYLTTPWAKEWIAGNYPEFAGRTFGTAEFPPGILEGADVTELFDRSRASLQGPFVRLFDLESDPTELENVAPRHPEVVERLTAELEGARAEAAALRSASGPPAAGERSEAMLEELRKLGYVRGER